MCGRVFPVSVSLVVGRHVQWIFVVFWVLWVDESSFNQFGASIVDVWLVGHVPEVGAYLVGCHLARERQTLIELFGHGIGPVFYIQERMELGRSIA